MRTGATLVPPVTEAPHLEVDILSDGVGQGAGGAGGAVPAVHAVPGVAAVVHPALVRRVALGTI